MTLLLDKVMSLMKQAMPSFKFFLLRNAEVTHVTLLLDKAMSHMK